MDILVFKPVLQLPGQVVVNTSASRQGRGRRVRAHVFVRVGFSGTNSNMYQNQFNDNFNTILIGLSFVRVYQHVQTLRILNAQTYVCSLDFEVGTLSAHG